MAVKTAAKKKKTVRRPAARAGRAARPKAPPAVRGAELMERLARAARIGALFIEGEDCIDALYPESRQWTLADDINYNPAVGVPLKKTLLRIEQIETFPCFAVLWRRRPDDAGRVEVILAGRMNSSYDEGKGKCPKIFPALKTVFDRGRAATAACSDRTFESTSLFRFGQVRVPRGDRLATGGKPVVSHFEPIRDSREQVVAALELTAVVTG